MPLTLKQRQGCPALPDQCVSKTDSMPGSFTGFPMDFSYGFFLWISFLLLSGWGQGDDPDRAAAGNQPLDGGALNQY